MQLEDLFANYLCYTYDMIEFHTWLILQVCLYLWYKSMYNVIKNCMQCCCGC